MESKASWIECCTNAYEEEKVCKLPDKISSYDNSKKGFLVTKVNHSLINGQLSCLIETNHGKINFSIPEDTRCCEKIGLIYEGSQLNDLVGSKIIRLDIDIHPKKVHPDLITKIESSLKEKSRLEGYGYLICKVTYLSSSQESNLYIIFTNINVDYGHRVNVMYDNRVLFNSWV